MSDTLCIQRCLKRLTTVHQSLEECCNLTVQSCDQAQSNYRERSQRSRQSIQTVLRREDELLNMLEAPQVALTCVQLERWDDALELWMQSRTWQLQQDIWSAHSGDNLTSSISARISTHVSDRVGNELSKQILSQLMDPDVPLPDLARALGRLRRLLTIGDVSGPLHIRRVHADARFTALASKTLLYGWLEASSMCLPFARIRQHSGPSAYTHTIPGQSLDTLKGRLDAASTSVPDLVRKFSILLPEGCNETESPTLIVTAAIASDLVADIRMYLEQASVLSHVMRLALLLHFTTEALRRFNMDLLAVLSSDLHNTIVYLTEQDLSRAVDAFLDDTTDDAQATAVTPTVLPNRTTQQRPMDADEQCVDVLLESPRLARLYNNILTVFNELRWYAAPALAPRLAAILRSTLYTCSNSIHNMLESPQGYPANQEASAKNPDSPSTTLARMFANVLVPRLWSSFHDHVFQLHANHAANSDTITEHSRLHQRISRQCQQLQADSQDEVCALLSV